MRLANAKESVDPILYELPFPGILPNHPLFFLKSLRDFLIEKTITNDVKRAEFYILQADKRLQMSLELSGDENSLLREATRNDAFLYREKSFIILRNALNKNIRVPRYVLEKLLLSTKKHEEVLRATKADAVSVTNLIPNIETLLNQDIDKK